LFEEHPGLRAIDTIVQKDYIPSQRKGGVIYDPIHAVFWQNIVVWIIERQGASRGMPSRIPEKEPLVRLYQTAFSPRRDI
jgi:hypothetical protein